MLATFCALQTIEEKSLYLGVVNNTLEHEAEEKLFPLLSGTSPAEFNHRLQVTTFNQPFFVK